MISVAHRGAWWPDRQAQNQLSAIVRATRAGYGLELDVRLVQGQLALQHDVYDSPWLLGREHEDWAALLVEALQQAPVILWDVKDVHVLRPLAVWLAQHALVSTARLFDLELAWENWHADLRADGAGLAYLRRASETESLFDALNDTGAVGVWLDTWEKEWIQPSTITAVQAAGKEAFVCSPELHQRPIDLRLWRAWAGATGLCTDFPHLHTRLDGAAFQPTGWHAAAHAEAP